MKGGVGRVCDLWRLPNGPKGLTRDTTNKSLDSMRDTYLRTDRRALYLTLKKYVDQAAEFTPFNPTTRLPMELRRREVHLLLRFGDALPAQALQLAAAEEYASRRGVHLMVEYAH